MDGTEQAVQTGFFGFTLWLKCALAGTAVGATVAAAQIFPGRWHPAGARHLTYWFSCPLFAGVATGVVVALRGVPPLSEARMFWLLLCLVIGCFTSVAAAGAVAFLTKNYDPDATSKTKRVSKRAGRSVLSRAEEWEDRLRALFRPLPAIQGAEKDGTSRGAARPESKPAQSIPGRRAELPPERYPPGAIRVKAPLPAGKPHARPRSASEQVGQGKLVKPIK